MASRVDPTFNERVCALVARIPEGRLMTYGQIATLCGYAFAAWEVGQIAHFGPSDLPWHRVVNKQGGMASGFIPDGPLGQRRLLEAEGVSFDDKNRADIGRLQWQPHD